MTVNRALRLVAGIAILISLGLAVYVNKNWLWFTAFIGVNLIQSAFTNWCPAMVILRAFTNWCPAMVILRKMGLKDEDKC